MEKIKIGTIGLGLMGCSIATCLLAAGHQVTSVIRNIAKAKDAADRVYAFLKQLKEEGRLKEEPDIVFERFKISDQLTDLAGVPLVLESILENMDQKKALFQQLEEIVDKETIIGSNTSAIPVTLLQKGLKHPERLLGVHWGEPAHVLRFLEIICGDESDIENANKVLHWAEGWGKEPSIVKKDIRGFISNRMMYAMMREAFNLVENGFATYEDIDRACRNDFGYWITFAGPFRFMDLTGIPAYLNVMKDLFPELSNSTEAPAIMKELVASGAKGVSNAKGFYNYTDETAKNWEDKFVSFTYEIRKLSEKYPQNVGDI